MNTLAHYVEKSMDDKAEWHTGPIDSGPRPPLMHPRRSLDEMDQRDGRVKTAVQTARNWAGRKRDGYADASIVLSGPYGTGKTHIALAILWSIIDTPDEYESMEVPAGKFYLANDLLLRLAPSQDPDTRVIYTPRPGHMLGTAPLVVVDDVGGQQIIPYVRGDQQEAELHARWFTFINHCYTLSTSIIMTTNLSLRGGHKSPLAQHLGGRAWDRLCEMAPAGFMVSLDGVSSWRVKAGGR